MTSGARFNTYFIVPSVRVNWCLSINTSPPPPAPPLRGVGSTSRRPPREGSLWIGNSTAFPN